jgi:hypothetical protein
MATYVKGVLMTGVHDTVSKLVVERILVGARAIASGHNMTAHQTGV